MSSQETKCDGCPTSSGSSEEFSPSAARAATVSSEHLKIISLKMWVEGWDFPEPLRSVLLGTWIPVLLRCFWSFYPGETNFRHPLLRILARGKTNPLIKVRQSLCFGNLPTVIYTSVYYLVLVTGFYMCMCGLFGFFLQCTYHKPQFKYNPNNQAVTSMSGPYPGCMFCRGWAHTI